MYKGKCDNCGSNNLNIDGICEECGKYSVVENTNNDEYSSLNKQYDYIKDIKYEANEIFYRIF